MIPTASNYPDAFDTDTNLYVVHDALRMRLTEDYNPGDTSIKVEGSFIVFDHLPPTGLITLTEQCSDLDKRAISFFYNNFDSTTGTFSGLELLPGFPDVKKPKRITDITMNVMSDHHNNPKEALINLQKFCGVKGTEDKAPLGETLEGRINFLRRVVLQPKAWFTANKRMGNVPLEVEFQDLSFRLGTDGTTGNIKLTWDFGDQNVSIISMPSLISVINETSIVPDDAIDVYVRDVDRGKIKKTYHQPGRYDVKLTVENDFGKDTVIFPDFINARVKAPNPAIVEFIVNSSTQEATPGIPPNGPFETFPKIRSPINTLVQLDVLDGENPATPGYSYAGEPLNGSGQAIDPVAIWTWELGDDLNHPSANEATASYSVGCLYNMKLRVDTEFGAYRITTYPDVIDVIEKKNMCSGYFRLAIWYGPMSTD
jgi:PKD repeat protein